MLNSNLKWIQRPGMTCMPIMCVKMKMSQDRHFKEGVLREHGMVLVALPNFNLLHLQLSVPGKTRNES